MTTVAIVLGDFIQGLGGGAVTFFIALPTAIAIRIAFRLPNNIRQGLEIFGLYVLLYALMKTFFGALPINVISIALIPNLLYLLCTSAFSQQGARLLHGSGAMATFLGVGIALVVAVLIRIA